MKQYPSTHDIIREHMESTLFESPKIPSYESLKETEWSTRFEQLMKSRLLMGAFRYGLMNAASKPQYNRMKDIRVRLSKYEETGNTELLVDIANMALMEFEEGIHPNKHFESKDDGVHTEK